MAPQEKTAGDRGYDDLATTLLLCLQFIKGSKLKGTPRTHTPQYKVGGDSMLQHLQQATKKKRAIKVHHHRHTSTMRKQKMQVKHLLPHCLKEPASQKQTAEERGGRGEGKEQQRGSCFSTWRRGGKESAGNGELTQEQTDTHTHTHKRARAHGHTHGHSLIHTPSWQTAALKWKPCPKKGFSHIHTLRPSTKKNKKRIAWLVPPPQHNAPAREILPEKPNTMQ